jgi:hypothetical protein
MLLSYGFFGRRKERGQLEKSGGNTWSNLVFSIFGEAHHVLESLVRYARRLFFPSDGPSFLRMLAR